MTDVQHYPVFIVQGLADDGPLMLLTINCRCGDRIVEREIDVRTMPIGSAVQLASEDVGVFEDHLEKTRHG